MWNNDLKPHAVVEAYQSCSWHLIFRFDFMQPEFKNTTRCGGGVLLH